MFDNEPPREEVFAGLYRGVVVRNDDPHGLSRVQARVPAINGDGVLHWALPCSPARPVAIPHRGDSVWIAFEHGNVDSPVWMGSWRGPETEGGIQHRTTVVYTTAALAAGHYEKGRVPLSVGYRVLRVQTDVPGRVRLYSTPAAQLQDQDRSISSDPTPGIGLMLDVLTAPYLLDVTLSPQVDGTSLESPPTKLIPITVTATDTGPVTVTLTYIRTE